MNFIKIAFPLANAVSFVRDLKTKQVISSAPHLIGQRNLAHSLWPLKWKQDSNINTRSGPIPLWQCLPALVSICLQLYLTFSSLPVSTNLTVPGVVSFREKSITCLGQHGRCHALSLFGGRRLYQSRGCVRWSHEKALQPTRLLLPLIVSHLNHN